MKSRFPPVVLISFDSLRQDHIGCYGCKEDITPNIDRLAQAGVRCVRHAANSCYTLPSHASMLTGTYPLTHCAVYWRRTKPLRPEVRLISEDLKAYGYRTFGVLSTNPYVRGSTTGFDRGFDIYRDTFPRKNALSEQFEAVITHLKECQNDPCFVFMHIQQCHIPFRSPEGYQKKYYEKFGKYATEIIYADHCFGQFIKDLSRADLLANTLLMVTTDHGHAFKDHGFNIKEATLYREVIDAALIMHYPGVLPAGRTIDSVSESVDILPTIIDIIGGKPRPAVQGKSLFSAALGLDPNPKKTTYAHVVYNSKDLLSEDNKPLDPMQCELFSARTKQFKFIQTHVLCEASQLMDKFRLRFEYRLSNSGEDTSLHKGMAFSELYNLETDPEEHVNVIKEYPGVRVKLRKRLIQWRKATTSEAGMQAAASGEEENQEVIARLTALGYF